MVLSCQPNKLQKWGQCEHNCRMGHIIIFTFFCATGHQYKVLTQMAADSSNGKGMLEIRLNGTWSFSEWVPATAAGKSLFIV